jgi:tryptophan-rich sensory protein
MTLTDFEWATLYAILVVWWVEPFGTVSSAYIRKRYKSMRTGFFRVPSWVFGPVWMTLYTMIAVSSWLYLNYSEPSRGYKDAVFSILLANYVLVKLWSRLFWQFRTQLPAFIDVVLVALTSVTVCVMLWVDASNIETYFAAAMFTFYPLWMIFVVFYSAVILYHNTM